MKTTNKPYSKGLTSVLSLSFSFSLLLGLIILFSSFSGCDKNEGLGCSNSITLNKPFIAKIGETWCRPDPWQITFGPLVEDSRCNVANIECVWAGRFVMAATIDNGEIIQDTFFAERNWQDTLYSGAYTIILNKVYPEMRLSTEPLDPSAYSFEVIVK